MSYTMLLYLKKQKKALNQPNRMQGAAHTLQPRLQHDHKCAATVTVIWQIM